MTAIAMTKTTDGRNLFRDSVSGSSDPTITYFALGSNSTSPTVSDHALGNETFRKSITGWSATTDGVILINVYVGPNDAVGLDIEEVGVFGGDSASSDANTGVMIGRGLWSHSNKLNTESFQLQLTLTF
jgi:hypothetical protein